MNYPAIILQDPQGDYSVCFPDLPGCISGGDSFDEALNNAQQAAQFHLEGMIEDGITIPEPSKIDPKQFSKDPDYSGAIWAAIHIDRKTLTKTTKTKRINITMPQNVIKGIDQYAQAHDQSRSALLTKAALQLIGK